MSKSRIIAAISLSFLITTLLTGCDTNLYEIRTFYNNSPATKGTQCIQSCIGIRNQCMVRAKKQDKTCKIPTLIKTAHGYMEESLNPELWGKYSKSCPNIRYDISCGISMSKTSCKNDFDKCMRSCGAIIQVVKSPTCIGLFD